MKRSYAVKTCLLMMLLCGCRWVCADDYVLDFSTKAGACGIYTKDWSWVDGDMEWLLSGAQNGNGKESIVRFGGKSNAKGVSYVKSMTPLPLVVREVVLNVQELVDEIKTFKLYVASDDSFENPIEVVNRTPVSGLVSFVPEKEEVWLAGMYYKLEVGWNNNTATNKAAQIASLTFKEGVPPPVYTVMATVNDESLGSVSVQGKVITVAPEACVTYGEPAWELLEGEGVVTQNGNVFVVAPKSDCQVRINLMPMDVYKVILEAGGGGLPGETELTQVDCTAPVVLPEPLSPCAQWTFVGWSDTPVDETNVMPQLIPVGEYLPTAHTTLYAVYQKVQGGESVQTLKMDLDATIGWEVQGVGRGGGDTAPYYILHEGAAIFSPPFDLSGIIDISARVRTYNNHSTLLVTDEADNEWGRVTAWENILFTEMGVKTQNLVGTGRLKFTSETVTATRGVGVSAITVRYVSVPLVYASQPDCESGSGTGVQSLQEQPVLYVEGRAVCFEAVGGQAFAVYTLSGNRFCSGLTGSGMNRIELPVGVHLLSVGEKVFKVVIAY